jgi:hypothetical protein
MNQRSRRLLLVCGIGLAWALTSVAPLWKYLSHSKAIIAIVLGLAGIALAMHYLQRLNRSGSQIALAWFLLLFLALTTAFAVLYPISLKHSSNSGSDREDALRIELNAVHHHQYPYSVRTFLGHLPTPLPGAMLLAAPFYAIGHTAWQNLLWIALFFVFTLRFFRFRATALVYLAAFLIFAPAQLSDLTSGGDYCINFFYVAIAVALFSHSLQQRLYFSIPAALFLGMTLSSRAIFIFMLVPLVALALQRTNRFRTFFLIAVVLAACATITLPIFTPAPLPHLFQQLQQTSTKLRFLPPALHAQWTLPALALLVSAVSFFVRMNLRRVFLIFSCSAFVILAPPVFGLVLLAHRLLYELSYFALFVLPISLWALSCFEDLSQSAAAPSLRPVPISRFRDVGSQPLVSGQARTARHPSWPGPTPQVRTTPKLMSAEGATHTSLGRSPR